MNLGITAIGALVIAVIGLTAGVLIFKAEQRLSKGELKKLMKWLYLTVLLCGFPYAMWNFLLEAELIQITDSFTKQLPGMILVTFFFLFMLKTSLIARQMGKTFGFQEETKTISEEMKK